MVKSKRLRALYRCGCICSAKPTKQALHLPAAAFDYLKRQASWTLPLGHKERLIGCLQAFTICAAISGGTMMIFRLATCDPQRLLRVGTYGIVACVVAT